MTDLTPTTQQLIVWILIIFYFPLNTLCDPSCSCNDALPSILTENAMNISIGDTHYFCVCSQYEWSSSGYLIKNGESYTFKVEGNQTWEDYHFNTTSFGYINKWMKLICCNDQWAPMDIHLQSIRYPSYPKWAALICCYGRIEDPTDTDSCFPVGNFTTKIIENLSQLTTSITIECYANDIVDMYNDNYGALNVTITRNS